MNFIQSHQADFSFPINLDHVIAISKDNFTESTAMIVFKTTAGNFSWHYYENKENRDSDYEYILEKILGVK